MHKAELVIFDKIYPILDFELILEKDNDPTGLPTSNPYGGKMTIQFASSKDDTDLIEAAMASRMMVRGIVRMYRRDGIQKLFDYEFANAYLLLFNETFDATSKNPVTTKIIIAPGILKRDSFVFQNYWNPSNPFLAAAAPISSTDDEELEPQFLGYHFEDSNNNEIPKSKIKPNQDVVLVLETENADGDTITIDLDDDDLDYEYNGAVLRNDILEGVTVTGEQTRIELKAVKQNQVV